MPGTVTSSTSLNAVQPDGATLLIDKDDHSCRLIRIKEQRLD